MQYDQSYTHEMAVQKVTFSLPRPLYRTAERVRQRTRQTRSAVMQEALRLWIARQNEATRVKRYVDGYRRKPERAADVAGLDDLAAEAWADLPW